MNEFASKLTEAYEIFYKNNMWMPKEGSSKSGIGSTLEYSSSFSKNLVSIIKKYNVSKIFDTSCGDWFWMRHIKESFDCYIGNDICKDLIEQNKLMYGTKNISFVCNDFLSQMKEYKDCEFDLIICRHTLEHLPTEYNIDSIEEMKRITKYAIITSANLHYSKNNNSTLNFNDNFIPPYNSINLDLSPYKSILNDPIEKIWDGLENIENKSIGTFGYLYKFN